MSGESGDHRLPQVPQPVRKSSLPSLARSPGVSQRHAPSSRGHWIVVSGGYLVNVSRVDLLGGVLFLFSSNGYFCVLVFQ